VISMLASGTQDRGFKTRPKPSDYSGVKFLSMPSLGRDVKQCGTLKNLCDYVEVEYKAVFCRPFSRPSFPPSLTERLHTRAARGSAEGCMGAPGVDGEN
jgi:hypothetical protein